MEEFNDRKYRQMMQQMRRSTTACALMLLTTGLASGHSAYRVFGADVGVAWLSAHLVIVVVVMMLNWTVLTDSLAGVREMVSIYGPVIVCFVTSLVAMLCSAFMAYAPAIAPDARSSSGSGSGASLFTLVMTNSSSA